MTIIRNRHPFGLRQCLAAALTLLWGATASFAADVTFAPGQRVGLALLPGLAVATSGFAGFESMDRRIKVMVIELPATAFSSVETQLKSGGPLPPNLQAAKPEPFDMVNGKGLLSSESGTDNGKKVRVFSLLAPATALTAYVTVQIEDGAPAAFSDEAIKTMLASTTVRSEAPVTEQLALLPFQVNELADFKTVRTLIPGVAVLMTDGNGNDADGSPYIVVTLMPGGPSQTDERARLAQQLANTIPGLTDLRVTSAEAMRIGGIPGYETRIEGKGSEAAGPVSVVQWLRFNGGTTLRIVAGTKKELWAEAFPRFRAVRDGIEPR